MIIIGKPYLEKEEERAALKSSYFDELNQIDETIYFSSSIDNFDYFSPELSDCFVVGTLLPAIISEQDIVVKGAMSEKLWYNLSRCVIYLVSMVYKKKKISIIPEGGLVNIDYHASGVACGCSLGVDSLTAILRHTEDNCPPSFKLSHLTCFNVGAFGSKDLELARQSYERDLTLIKDFAKEINLPLVCIESNIAITHGDALSFDECCVFRNMSTILSMQKKFGKYYFGSSCSVKDSFITRVDMGYYADIVIPRLSTESTQLFVSESDMTRVDKTRYISQNKLAQKHLYVCWKEIFKNEYPKYWEKIKESADANRNCTMCDKCLRTLLTLDILGCIHLYEKIFDINQYYKQRNNYIIKVLSNQNASPFYREIRELMVENQFPIPSSVKAKVFLKSMQKIILYIPKRVYHLVIK